ncbi:hypothetical protein QNH39_23550 [Neobacillus novalis]|uniref:Uncharacterized protein n=1 Tax=Neobacillus novalis TaxID=220687 RepID=A0AA95MQU9_9BACI|nr:hypothetical protein [Neobacillus novalis]WHY85551.1 hypothetical protein QNH39_23550 [Neobacillus novalis]
MEKKGHQENEKYILSENYFNVKTRERMEGTDSNRFVRKRRRAVLSIFLLLAR